MKREDFTYQIFRTDYADGHSDYHACAKRFKRKVLGIFPCYEHYKLTGSRISMYAEHAHRFNSYEECKQKVESGILEYIKARLSETITSVKEL